MRLLKRWRQVVLTMPKITLVTQKDTSLTKQQNINGGFESASTVYDAKGQTVELSLAQLKPMLDGFYNDQALVLGTASTEEESYKIVSDVEKQKGREGITRTKDNFTFADEPSLMLLDIDYKQCPSQISSVDPMQMLQQALGATFGYVRRASTTAGIIAPGGTPLEGSDGCHIYVTIQKGKEIPQMLELIHQRLVLAGYGFVFISRAGTAQVRTPVDVCVGSPERVIYEAPPILLDGYTQAREAEYVEGCQLLSSPLTGGEKTEFQRIKMTLMAEAQPMIYEVKELWRITRGYSKKQTEEIFKSKCLPSDFPLINNDESEFTVADVWGDYDKYANRSIPDPLEPEYGKSKAKIFVNKGDSGAVESIIINSMAHGGEVSYRLMQSAEQIFCDPSSPKKAKGIFKFTLNGSSDAMSKKMLEEKYIMGRMALLGQYTVIYAPPNAGKTLITLKELSASAARNDIDGCMVVYVNADDNYKGLITKLKIAEENNIQMVAPGHNGFKVEDLIGILKEMTKDGSAHGCVVVLDTLKKFTDPMDKSSTSYFNTVVRAFISNGGTVIGLAHVNKHQGVDGRNIHAGTTDIKDDCDCVYVATVLNDIGDQKTVEFMNEKSRGDVAQSVSYTYTKKEGEGYRQIFDSIKVVSDDAQDAVRLQCKAESARNNKDVIDTMKAVISTGNNKKTGLVEAVHKATSNTKPSIRKLLDLHTGESLDDYEFWKCDLGSKNTHVYHINERAPELLNNDHSFL